MHKLLIIDDDPEVFSIVKHLYDQKQVQVYSARTADEGLRQTRELKPAVVLLDHNLGERSGLQIMHELREISENSLVVFLTGHGSTDTVIEAMKQGAHDYLVKPIDLHHLEQVISRAFEISERATTDSSKLANPTKSQSESEKLIGNSPAMQTVAKEIGRVAAQDVTVLILGESGTGKELVSRAIFEHSHRNQGPFIAINCAAIPEALLESELFGHEKGAFTGADHRRIGKFEQCHGGTLLLDEVGDMAPNTQSKLLRILEERCFERVGGNESISVDVRILAATNQDLELRIEEGRFRKDLYYRLRGVAIHLPPLRERREDIPLLAMHFVTRCSREMDMAIQSISPEAIALLSKYSWPGNIRELQATIREALLRSSGSVLLPEFLPQALLDGPSETPGGDATPAENWQRLGEVLEGWFSSGQTDLYRRALEHFDRLILTRAVKQSNGNQTKASEILGISRFTLRSKLRSANLAIGKVVLPPNTGLV
ncbi:MAG: sigma-54-dependent Fis family transcriptional regulator [Schlesneria sp.]|nr:sigma-54-dependent Fis family transcriptional regulator [Schlesneria sp.]